MLAGLTQAHSAPPDTGEHESRSTLAGGMGPKQRSKWPLEGPINGRRRVTSFTGGAATGGWHYGAADLVWSQIILHAAAPSQPQPATVVSATLVAIVAHWHDIYF